MSRISKLCGTALGVGLIWLTDAAAQFIPGFATGRLIREEQRDEIADQTIYLGYFSTLRTSIGARPISTGPASLSIAAAKKPRSCSFWSRSTAGTKNLSVAFRFEGQPGHVTKARYVKRTKQVTNDLADVRRFLDGAFEVERPLRLGDVRSLLEQRRRASRIDTAGMIVQRLRAACPILAETS